MIVYIQNQVTYFWGFVKGLKVSGAGKIPASNADSPTFRRAGCFPK